MGLEELVVGISKLRGDARRSDIVAVNLVVRSIQKALNRFEESATARLENLDRACRQKSVIAHKSRATPVFSKDDTAAPACIEGNVAVSDALKEIQQDPHSDADGLDETARFGGALGLPSEASLEEQDREPPASGAFFPPWFQSPTHIPQAGT